MAENLDGKWALVTGASGGLGAEFAAQLAAMGVNCVLVARREDRLHAVAGDIAHQYGVQAEIVVLDLAEPDAPQVLFDQLQQAGRHIDILVNNAGFGLYGRFSDLDWAREAEMLQIDVFTLVHLTRLFAPEMVSQGGGYVLNVSSIGAFQPAPLYAAYAAAKAFVLTFSEAVNYELRGSGVSITASCPGPTATEFLAVAGQEMTRYQRLTLMQADDVVRASLRAMLRRKASIVPGRLQALMAWTTRLVPRRIAARLAESAMK